MDSAQEKSDMIFSPKKVQPVPPRRAPPGKSKFGRNIVAEFKRQIMPKPAVNGGGKGC